MSESWLGETFLRIVPDDQNRGRRFKRGLDQASPASTDVVVLVDDDPEVLAALQRLLSKEGYLLLPTSDPRQALSWTKTREISLIISDHLMPVMDGAELLREVSMGSPLTERLMLTAHEAKPAVVEGYNLGFWWVIPKPWDGAALRRTIRGRLRARRRLISEFLRIAERERRRVGQLLHDVLGQDLTGLSLLCKALENRLRSRGAQEVPVAEKTTATATRSLRHARALSHGLNPVDLEASSLRRCVDQLAAQVNDAGGVRCRVRWAPGFIVRTASVAEQVYWIVHEAVTNACRHAKAGRVEIRAMRYQQKARIQVQDDGRGLTAGRPQGTGLRTMLLRARLMDAVFRLESPAAGGTRITCVLPSKLMAPIKR